MQDSSPEQSDGSIGEDLEESTKSSEEEWQQSSAELSKTSSRSSTSTSKSTKVTIKFGGKVVKSYTYTRPSDSDEDEIVGEEQTDESVEDMDLL